MPSLHKKYWMVSNVHVVNDAKRVYSPDASRKRSTQFNVYLEFPL